MKNKIIKTEKPFLSKREDNTYCIIHQAIPINQFTTKEICIRTAKDLLLTLSTQIWSAKDGKFIIEIN